jgi:mono/diheme cytochrome c family protein
MTSARTLPVLLVLLLAASEAPSAHAARAARDNYQENCAGCHGPDGKAQTRLGRKSGAKDLTNRASMTKLSDADIFATIKSGRKNAKGEETMEAFGPVLADKEITELVAFVRTFSK